MTARSFIVRCSHCKKTQTINATLENARRVRCGICHQMMTVSGYREGGETKAGEPPAVMTAPGAEKATWPNTREQDDIVRGLVLSALGEE